MSRCGDMAIRNLSEMAACRQLGFNVTGNCAILSADPENPTIEPNMKCIGSPVAQIRPFEIFQHVGRHLGNIRTRTVRLLALMFLLRAAD